MRKYSFVLLPALVITCATVQAQTTSSILWSRGQTIVPGGPVYYTIWKMRDDGTGQTALTIVVAGQDDRRPSICPKGRKIVFDRTSAGETDILKMATSGLGQTSITSTHPGILHEDPDCGSPDSVTEYIVYRSTRDTPDGTGEIYRMDLNGNNVMRLTNDDNLPVHYEDRDPAWCGQTVVWSRKVGNRWEIWQANWLDGTNAHQVTLPTDSNDDRYPACNPASTIVTFSREPVGSFFGGIGIWTRDLFTGTETEVTECDEGVGIYSVCLHPAWSPGGNQIVFSRDDACTCQPADIWKIVSDSTGLMQLSTNGDDDVQPDWGEIAP